MLLRDLLARLDGKSALTADDAAALRQLVFGESPAVSQEEAEALFKLNADAGSLSPEWSQLFVEAMIEYAVHQDDPVGYIDQAKADWLIAQVRKAGRVREDEIEMLIHALEEASQSPAVLSDFVLESVKTIALKKLESGQTLGADDVERLRRVIYARGGDGNIAVTRHEAETLFDINDALKAAKADPSWTELFKRAVANAVLFQSPWHADRDAEMKRQAWLSDTQIHPFRDIVAGLRAPAALGAMRQEASDLVHFDFQDHFADRAYAAEVAVQADAERLTDDEVHWLVERMRRGGRPDENERALVDFIRANARASDPQVTALLAALNAVADPV
jgi:hypothetical protein